MPIQYDGKKLIPAPLVNISQEYVKNGDVLLSTLYRITLNGQMVAHKGSPTSSGTFWTLSGYPDDESLTHDEHMKSILIKQAVIRQLFSNEGKSLEIQPWDGSTPLKCNPRIISVDVPEGQWYTTAPYSVVLEADTMYGPLTPDGEVAISGYLSDAKEEWTMELGEPIREPNNEGVYSYRLTHTLSAVGRKHYEVDGSYTEPWINARDWVINRLGVDWNQVYATGVLNAPTGMMTGALTAYNHVRSQTVDELGGLFSVSETWLLSPQNVIEDFTVETKTSIEDGLTKVSIQGSIQGLEIRDSNYVLTQNKYAPIALITDAALGMTVLNRVQTYAAQSLNATPVTSVIGRNPVVGNLNYSYEFDTRPSNLIDGAISEVITIVDKNPNDVFASLPVLGREVGPVLQDMNTQTHAERSLSVEIVVTPSNDLLTGQPDVSSIIEIVRPVATNVFKSNDEVTWLPKSGRYNRNISWIYNEDE